MAKVEVKKSTACKIETLVGSFVVPINQRVFTKVGNKYASRAPDELANGELVLVAKEGVTLPTMDRVEEALAKSERYVNSRPILFKEKSDGTFTTSFACALIGGIASKPEAWPEELRNVNITFNGELSSDARDLIAQTIHAKLVEKDVPAVSLDHIKYSWLGGKVIAPKNFEKIVPALVDLSPNLTILETPEFKAAYATYVRIRSTVMNRLSLVFGSSEKAIPRETVSAGQAMSIAPEIQLVAQYFADEVSATHVAAAVLNVEGIVGEGEQKNSEEGKFKKGLVISPEQAKKAGVEVLDYGDLFRQIDTLRILEIRIVAEAVALMVTSAQIGLDSLFDTIDSAVAINLEDVLYPDSARKKRSKLCETLKGIVDKTVDDPNLRNELYRLRPFQVRSDPSSDVIELSKKHLFTLVDGTLDSYLALDSGRIMELLETLYRLRAARPVSFEVMTQVGLLYVSVPDSKKALCKRLKKEVDLNARRLNSLFTSTTAFSAFEFTLDHAVPGQRTLAGNMFYRGKMKLDYAISLIPPSANLLPIRSDASDLETLRQMGFADFAHLYPRRDAYLELRALQPSPFDL